MRKFRRTGSAKRRLQVDPTTVGTRRSAAGTTSCPVAATINGSQPSGGRIKKGENFKGRLAWTSKAQTFVAKLNRMRGCHRSPLPRPLSGDRLRLFAEHYEEPAEAQVHRESWAGPEAASPEIGPLSHELNNPLTSSGVLPGTLK